MNLNNKNDDIKNTVPAFGAFVMTYERPAVLQKTVQKLRAQTFPPTHILIVDNSETEETAEAVERIAGDDLEYVRVGYNSGPAGAAKRGLHMLAEKGFQWIYWGDDDNPPEDDSIFERYFIKIVQLEKAGRRVGIFGGRGGQFNRFTGRIRSLSNNDLLQNNLIEVDAVPGGHTMLVNAGVVKEGILPIEKLFFGFEEFDFCIRVRKNGFSAFVDASSWYEANLNSGFEAAGYRWKGSTFGKPAFLWRDYHGTRNLLYIFFREKYVFPFLFLLVKTMIKSILGFRYGWGYGRGNFLVQWKCIKDFLGGNYGMGWMEKENSVEKRIK